MYTGHSFGLENNFGHCRKQGSLFLPAAGNRNGSELNNAGENGNYWSSSLNADNPNNAWNFNFNADDQNMNNNNRNNGQSVRPVRSAREHFPDGYSVYRLTREGLLADLRRAFSDACRHKRRKPYVRRFEADLEQNLAALCDELFERRYRPRPSSCFIITDPKKREVFAADFRDRIVHHLYYNYTHTLFERTFVHDSYSCIRGRGTHYGIRRLAQHIRRESQGYTVPCWVLKMDIRGYFMHIDRRRLRDICQETLDRMASHFVSPSRDRRWREVLDMDFVRYLTEVIVMLDPTENCRIAGSPDDWEGLPHDKSLFHSPAGCGLPIGNLTSQLFSNVYLNVLDQYMKRELGCRHYGRYVDDFYVVSADRQWLTTLPPQVRRVLKERLGLDLHDGKLGITSVWHGVEFLGAWLKPRRAYMSRCTVGRIGRKIGALAAGSPAKWEASLNSYCGLLAHGSNYALRRRLLAGRAEFASLGVFDLAVRHYSMLPQGFGSSTMLQIY